MDRYFTVICAGNRKLNGLTGKLIGDVDYVGCKSGWYTLDIEGKHYLFTGNEIREVSDYKESTTEASNVS